MLAISAKTFQNDSSIDPSHCLCWLCCSPFVGQGSIVGRQKQLLAIAGWCHQQLTMVVKRNAQQTVAWWICRMALQVIGDCSKLFYALGDTLHPAHACLLKSFDKPLTSAVSSPPRYRHPCRLAMNCNGTMTSWIMWRHMQSHIVTECQWCHLYPLHSIMPGLCPVSI